MMAICTQCGAIMNDLDMEKHFCNPADVPAKGKIRKPQTTEVNI